jgi:DNA-directed RNA polymerase specialized sigma24 family protein
MSPLSIRRYRAERLLREEFEVLRGRVLASVRGRLGGSGASLDQSDLEACYAQAWQGLYAAVLEGQEIANPAGWLVLVTFRRAIEELRAQGRAHRDGILRAPGAGSWGAGEEPESETFGDVGGAERDLAEELDDRIRLRQLFEGLQRRLDGREREAATLCYLQGLSRAEAAARMGVSDARMRKLMEGRGPARPGVAGKVGALVQTIRAGEWCQEQASLMRAFAYGILDADGERYRLAILHSDQCPACRAYVASLRGLAAALPPVLLPWGLGAAVLTGFGESVGAGGPGGASAAGGGLQAGGGLGAAAAASGAAGAGGAAGGGWLLGAGSLGGKLAVGCLLALGVGAGCVAIDGEQSAHSASHRRHAATDTARTRQGAGSLVGYAPAEPLASAAGAGIRSAAGDDASAALAPSAQASREFGPEQPSAPASGRSSSAAARRVSIARTASSSAVPTASPAGASGLPQASTSSAEGSSTSSAVPDSKAAEREFSPG